jgi:competence protein ComEC
MAMVALKSAGDHHLEYTTAEHPRPTRWLRTDPMVLVTALFLAGIIVGRYGHLPVQWVWWIACGGFTAAILILLIIYLQPQRHGRHVSGQSDIAENSRQPPNVEKPKLQSARWLRYGAWILLALVIVLAGVARWQINQELLPADDIARSAPAHGRKFVTARMLITSAPEFHPVPPRGVLFSALGPSTTFFARVAASRVNGRWKHTTGNVVVRVPGYLPALRNNQWIQLTGWLSKPPVAENPGGFNYRLYLSSFRVFSEISASQAEQLRVLSNQQSLFPVSGWMDAWRHHLRQRIIADHPRHARTNGYALIALLLGYRDPSIRPLARAFSRAGAAHLLALSGMHVVMIAAAIWMILKFLLHRPRQRAAVTLILVLVYMLMTPCGPPVVRAAVGTALVLISWILSRPVRPLNILAMTALIVTLWRPAEIFQPPFQLSFVVTLGLILLAHRVHLVLFHPWLTRQGDIARAIGTRRAALKVHVMAWIAAIVTANLVGSFVALPLVAYHYNQFNPLSVINGLILLPLVGAALIAGLLELAAGFGSPALGHAAALAAGPVAGALAWAVQFLAALPGSEIIVRSPPVLLILVFFAILSAWMFRKNMRLTRPVIAGGFALWSLSLISWYGITAQHAGAEIWLLDAGSGDAVVIHARKTVLLDAGSLGSATRMAESVDTTLRKLGLWHLDAMVITQIDSAHAAAAPNIVRRHGALSGWCDPMDQQSPAPAARRFVSAATAAGLTLSSATESQRMILGGKTQLTVLWPKNNAVVPRKLRGLIVVLQHHGQRVLLLARTQAVRGVLRNLNVPAHLAGVVLLGAGTVRKSFIHWLIRMKPQWIVSTGETRAAAISDKRLVSGAGIPFFQTRSLGAIHLTLRNGKSVISWQRVRGSRVSGRPGRNRNLISSTSVVPGQ